ncbi:MAG: hypothetical protein ABI572_07660, partial [Actinomycetota bacterium]
MSDPVRVVVAEGLSTRKGLLRFVLEGEGYEVVGEASTSAELARTVASFRPDVVVIDDGIGAMAVGMIREIVPSLRVILVWPGAVVPIGGDARVEPSEVLRELGRTMERLTGQPSATGEQEGLMESDPLEPVHQDPASLREILARGEAARLRRPPDRSVRGSTATRSGEPAIERREPAAVVILPVTPSVEAPSEPALEPAAEPAAPMDGDRVVAMAGADREQPRPSESRVPIDDPEASEFNRKLGTIALGGAAAAGVLVLALAFGGSRVPVVEIRGESPIGGSEGSPVTIDPVEPSDAGVSIPDGTTGTWVGDGVRLFGRSSPAPGGSTASSGGLGSGTGGTGGGGTGGGGTGGGGTGGGGT